MSNFDRVNEDIEVLKSGKHWDKDSSRYKHPSFGMLRISRYTGGGGKHFGSEIESNGGVTIEISEAEVTQGLGKNWYYDSKTIVEVSMSPVQYAEAISNPNTQGQPCTIRYRQDKGHIVYKGIDTVAQYAESAVSKQLEELKENVDSLVEKHNAIISKKGALNKADKEAAKALTQRIQTTLSSNMDFYIRSVQEALEHSKAEAKADIGSYATAMISRAGIEALSDPKVITALEDKPDA